MKQTSIDDFLDLERRIKEEVEKNKNKDKLIFQQNKNGSIR